MIISWVVLEDIFLQLGWWWSDYVGDLIHLKWCSFGFPPTVSHIPWTGNNFKDINNPATGMNLWVCGYFQTASSVPLRIQEPQRQSKFRTRALGTLWRVCLNLYPINWQKKVPTVMANDSWIPIVHLPHGRVRPRSCREYCNVACYESD